MRTAQQYSEQGGSVLWFAAIEYVCGELHFISGLQDRIYEAQGQGRSDGRR